MIAIGDYTISEVYDGESIQGDTGATISTSTEQYYLSDYNNRLSGGSWSDTEPSSIPSGKYLWGRWKFTMTDGEIRYSNAVYRSTIQGIESKVDTLDGSITNKVWQTDIDNSINSYDGSTVSSIRNRVSQNEQDIDGIETNISNLSTTVENKADSSTVTTLTETVNNVKQTADGNKSTVSKLTTTLGTNADGTTKAGDIVHRTTANETSITQTANSITSLVSNEETYTKPDGTTGTNTIHSAIKQNADNINLKVDKNGVIAAINLSTETDGGSSAKISADKVNIEGATIFTSGRLSSESLNNTYDPKGSIYDSGNMLLDAYAPSLTKVNAKYNRYFSDASNTSTVCSFVSAENEVLPDPNAKYFVRIKNTELNKYRALCFYGSANYENASGLVVGDTYKVSCWVRQLEGSSNFFINLGGVGGKNYTDTTFVPSTEWQKYEKVFTFTDHNKETSTVWSRLYFYNRAGSEINGAGTGVGQIDMCGFKLEHINAIAASGRNLCLRSADYSGWGKNNGATFDGNIITFPTVTANTWRSAWVGNTLPYSVVRNQKITVTFKIKGTAGEILSPYFSFALNSASTRRLKYIDKYQPIYGTGEWQTVALSMYVNDSAFVSGSGSPNYDSCYFEIQVGATGDTNGRNGFQMKEIMVALGSDPCAWSPAPEDGVAQEQRIYYRTNTTSAPDAPSTWVTSTATANDTWTTKRMQYDKTYPYLFTCIQRINIGGTVSNTDVLLDDTTTVIDGGKIITGSVTTEQLATDAIKSLDYGAPASGSQFSTKGTFFNLADQGEFRSKNFAIDKNGNAYFNGALTATSLTIAPGATFDGDIDQFKGASFNWNLLLETATPVTWTVALNTSNYMVKDCYKTISPVPKLFAVNDLVTIAFDWSTTATGGNFHVECGTVTPYGWGTVVSAEGGRSSTSNYVDISSSKQSGHFKVTFKVGTAQTGAADTLQWLRIRVDGADTSGKSFTISNAKAERGSMASDWCTAESEIHGKDGISTVGLAMKVNYSGFATASGGECYFHGYNNQNEEADADGWVIWNGEKLTITKGMWINPNGAVPVNTPIFHVFRTSASPYHSDVWWDSSLLAWRGYAYTADKVPGTKANWTWNEATDCILAVYVATGSEAISSAQLFTTPKKFSELPDPDNIHSIVDTSIDNIAIGGRNLLQGTANPQISASYNPPYYNVRSGGDGVGSIESIEDSPVTGVTRAFRITGNTTGNRDFVQPIKDFNILWTDGQWMFSCYARGIDASATALIRVYTANLAFQANISVGTSWTRIEVPISLNGSGATTNEIKFQFGIAGAGSIEYIAPMLERGTKASAWSYAPEDVDSSINGAKELANNALGNAATAQGTANTALKNAAVADGKAVSAQSTANVANGKADEALNKYNILQKGLSDYEEVRNLYLDFDPNPSVGLFIGAKTKSGDDSIFRTHITNTKLAFEENGTDVAWISNSQLFVNQGIIETGLRVGNFVIFDEDGALNIKYEPLS